MVLSGDKLVCIVGNPFFEKGAVYIVGDIVNKELFEVRIGSDGEYWYAKKDNEGICVHFNAKETAINDAWFSQVK
ncbi:MAG: hypothetical protein L0G63_09260 [Psychrobacter sp.]|uniref:hypothetical protein n=1 Tax=Psychrobacter sp. TaxID=56811 RepID=UPI00264740ED|nr:hypothetical protein [Psychrobacter sp.]MDN5620646.1 hypothetical protein [Psychrobacter sp.]